MTRARATGITRPHPATLRFAALAALGILGAHDSVYMAQYGLGNGYEAAMARTVHGYWPAFVLFTVVAGGALAVMAARGLVQLGRLVRGLPPSLRDPGRSAYPAEVRRLWPRLFTVVTTGFLLQENAEHVLAGAPLPGLWVLSAPEYPLAIPGILVVTGLLAATGAWFQWRRKILIGRLRAARVAALRRHRCAPRAPHGRWALLAALLANRWTLLRRDAERAPPSGCAA